MRRMVGRLTLAALLVASTAAAQPVRERMLLAEDARGPGAEGVAVLVEGLASRDAAVRRQAVIALGRFERPALTAPLAPLLADPDPRVRAEAANALAQVADASNVATVQSRLLDRLASEVDPAARAAVAASVGRLPYTDAAQVTRAEQALATLLHAQSDPTVKAGAARGLEALVRGSRKLAAPDAATIEALLAAAGLGRGDGDERLARVRRFAWLALAQTGRFDRTSLASALDDPDAEVRRLAIAAAGTETPLDDRVSLLRKGLSDRNPRVRYEALNAWGRRLQTTSCEPIREALDDGDAHVRLRAIDLLGAGCGDGLPADTLESLARGLRPAPAPWHTASHALVSLARVAPDRAAPLFGRFSGHDTWQVRMYAARAAAAAKDAATLIALAADRHDNVREAALAGLVDLRRPEAVTVAIEALNTRRDYQLLLGAARALSAKHGLVSPDRVPEARGALADALARVSGEERETSRDPRMAMLDRLEELGPPEPALGPSPIDTPRASSVETLRARLVDFDPVVARRAAEVLTAWTGSPQSAEPRPLARPRLDLSRVADRDVRLRFTMRGGRTFTLRMLTDEAPLSVARVVSLAGRGYYDGLTFHRVVPNFVIQGGSPGANEYVGDGPFMRDEPGLRSHTRGTVGISTRGRDTGDAQLFVNLVDSPRLDHTYTVVAEIIDGMDVVDGILEGDVIERVAVERP